MLAIACKITLKIRNDIYLCVLMYQNKNKELMIKWMCCHTIKLLQVDY